MLPLASLPSLLVFLGTCAFSLSKSFRFSFLVSLSLVSRLSFSLLSVSVRTQKLVRCLLWGSVRGPLIRNLYSRGPYLYLLICRSKAQAHCTNNKDKDAPDDDDDDDVMENRGTDRVDFTH